MQSLSSAADNKNTMKSTNNWVRVYREWAKERELCQNLQEPDTETLDATLVQSYAEIRKQNGHEYEPDSL